MLFIKFLYVTPLGLADIWGHLELLGVNFVLPLFISIIRLTQLYSNLANKLVVQLLFYFSLHKRWVIPIIRFKSPLKNVGFRYLFCGREKHPGGPE